MVYQSLIFAILFLLLSFLSPAYGDLSVCTADAQSCEFYSCVEQHFNCGKNGYLKKFGYKNCQRYLNIQSRSSKALQEWYPKVRFCLQAQLAEIADATATTTKACKNIEQLAFDSHVDCYLETGFCGLSFLDKLAVASVAGKDLFTLESLKTEAEISAACAQLPK